MSIVPRHRPIIPPTFWSLSVQAIAPQIAYNGPMPTRPRDYYALTVDSWNRCFVYVLADGDHRVLYVGMSHRPGNRFDKHKMYKVWWPDVSQVVILQVEGEDNRDGRYVAAWLEKYAIRKLRPEHNIAGACV